MPSDIRSFFGSGGAKSLTKPGFPKSNKDGDGAKVTPKQRGRRKIVSDDDDDDEEVVVDTTFRRPSIPKAKKSATEPVEEETTSSAYFAATKSKPARSTPMRNKTATTNGAGKTPTKEINGGTPSTGRRSSRKTSKKNYAEDDEDENSNVVLKDDLEGNDDIFSDMKSRKVEDDYEEGTDENDLRPQKEVGKSVNGHSKRPQSDDDGDIEMVQIPAHNGPGDARRKKTPAKAASNRKRKSKALEDEDEDDLDEDEDDDTPKKKPRTATSAAARKPRTTAKKEEREESKEIQNILDSIPTVRAPTPPPRDEKRKFQYGGGNASVAPPADGTADIPVGAENCLAGLTFVFTGVLNTLGREEGQNLVKQYGGKVTGAPSKRTSYVVIGADAGPKKLETIRQLGIKTINEEGLFALIRQLPANGGDGKAAEAYAEKQAKEEEKIRQQAEDEEKRERERQKEAAKIAKAAAARSGAPLPSAKSQGPKVDDRLWVDKYAPDTMSAVCGNKGQVEGLQRWLRNWPKAAKSDFKKAGADGKGVFRAALLHGPPGVGKTTAAHLVAKLEGYDVVESNASETRNKKLLETGLTGVLDTTSILGYFAGNGKKVESSKRKLLLIMDEVDGMSAGDRGGVGALASIVKKTNVPMILICNERNQPKMRPLNNVTAEFQFRRPTTDMIRGRIATILFREGMKLPMPIINALIEGCNGDIRQIINMISTIKLDNKDLDFSDTKAMSKAWEKHVILKPWDIVNKILRPQMFAVSSIATLNDKTELYFNDHEMSYLMLQENYLKTNPALATSYSGKEREMKLLELADNAAASISDGDLVDRMIHGSQQQWSLMPVHGIFSFVRPASYVYGMLGGHATFPSWFGQNSKQMKLSRFVKEIQGHMRLRTSADRHEIRQQYLPALWSETIGVLKNKGKDAVQDVIDFMDSYYLTKEDFDSVLELGVGEYDMENIKIDTATKASFTRLYNSQSHPMPFVKASHVLGVAKGGAKREKPDLEEAVDESEAEELLAEAEAGDEEEDDSDLKKDKYIQAPKKKAAGTSAAGGASSKGKGKRKKADEAGDVDAESEEEPKKKRGGGGGARGGRKGKGRA
ncbi:replication factor C subunit 1 [Cladophialophora psammophila CBS 110553]|uniref:Replication factor C subunit 1 n=1 Tax=Cladophialophora psammophila CBS 110553 TaxID=1182543 RepID=W9VPY4_9EURO|nr:replication factor C subunit 1 [Cladophialophora psammophila CBS 110553]EXJ57787.1 replication factor C subunit 1 [Cladophialophora psammophila CBS 110553]